MTKIAVVVIASVLLPLTSASHAAQEPPAKVVSRLYRDFAWEAVMADWAGHGLAEQPYRVLTGYFTPKLAAALVADEVCIAKTHEVCRLDFVPLWAAQDPGAQDLSITQEGPTRVEVEFRYPSTGEKLTLHFTLVLSKVGWRISDISYPSGQSLSKLLSGYAQ